MRMGAQPKACYLFFKSLNPLVNVLLQTLRNVIFPPELLPTVQPFKNEKQSNYNRDDNNYVADFKYGSRAIEPGT